jgi:hypothetical protein
MTSPCLAGLLIPRSQVRILPGPCDLQGFCRPIAAERVRMFVRARVPERRSAPRSCRILPCHAVWLSSLQLVHGESESHCSPASQLPRLYLGTFAELRPVTPGIAGASPVAPSLRTHQPLDRRTMPPPGQSARLPPPAIKTTDHEPALNPPLRPDAASGDRTCHA